MAPRSRGGRVSRPLRNPARRILVVTEGEKTEPQYVQGLNAYLRSAGTTAVVKAAGVGKDPLKVVLKCIELRDTAVKKEKGYDHCVCLVDVDQHSTLPAALNLAAAEEILLLISNLKFEVWLRWHVEDKRPALNNTQLDHCVEELGLLKDKSLVHPFPFDGVHDAYQTAYLADPDLAAGRKGPDPSSAMPVLVALMRGIPPRI